MFLVSVECISTCKIQHVYKSILLFLFRDLFVRLKDSGKVNGFMIIENTPNAYSPDAQCPNDQSGEDLFNKYQDSFLFATFSKIGVPHVGRKSCQTLATQNTCIASTARSTHYRCLVSIKLATVDFRHVVSIPMLIHNRF